MHMTSNYTMYIPLFPLPSSLSSGGRHPPLFPLPSSLFPLPPPLSPLPLGHPTSPHNLFSEPLCDDAIDLWGT